jgi:hypothetical protein
MKQYMTLMGEPGEQYHKRPYSEYDVHISAQLEAASQRGWRLVHTASHTPITTERYSRPMFYCLLERDPPPPCERFVLDDRESSKCANCGVEMRDHAPDAAGSDP